MSDRASDPMHPQACRVTRVRRETADTFTLEMEPARGPRAFRFAPGQFNMLYVFGVGEVPISLSGGPTRAGRFAHTTRAVGTVTKALRNLKRGDVLGVRGPYGNPWPVEEAGGRDVVIVAGGIGLAPLRPALSHLLAHRPRYGTISLLYGARTPADLLYRRELERWRARLDVEVQVTVDRAMSRWHGHVGVVTALMHRASFDPRNTMAFICGPEVMMRFTAREFVARGVRAERLYLSMERNMKCAVGFCGHCQFGPMFVCKDGPVFRYDRVQSLLNIREL